MPAKGWRTSSPSTLTAAGHSLVKNAIQDAPRYSMRSLRAAVEVLTDTETAMKSGGGEDKTLLEEAVFKILTLRSKG